MKKAISFVLTAIFLISSVSILSSCAGVAESTEIPTEASSETVGPTDTGKTDEPELTEEERNSIADETIYILHTSLLGHGSSSERPLYYLENYSPTVYENIPMYMKNAATYSLYGAVHRLELPRWLVLEGFSESGFSWALREDLLNALYSSFDDEEFYRYLCDNAERIRYELVPLLFERDFVMKYLQPYAQEKSYVNGEDKYREWFFSRNMRHSEILEKYMGVTSERLIEETHVSEYLFYVDRWTYEQVSIAEFVIEFDISQTEFWKMYKAAVKEFGASRFGVDVPDYAYKFYLANGGGRITGDIHYAKTMSDVYELNRKIRI